MGCDCENSTNYVIEGVKVKIRDLVKMIFEKLDIKNWEKYIVSSPELYRENLTTEVHGVKLTDLDSLEQIIEKCLILQPPAILAD